MRLPTIYQVPFSAASATPDLAVTEVACIDSPAGFSHTGREVFLRLMLYQHNRNHWMELHMARIPTAARENIPHNLQQAFDTVVQSRGGLPRTGPVSVMINSPEACRRAFHFSDYLRNESTLAKHVQELAMLVTARVFDCQYIWNAHAASGKSTGLSAALVEALRDNTALPSLRPEEAAVIKYGQEFYRTHRVSRGTFQEAWEQFGTQGLAELTMIMGFYAMLAFHLNAFDVDLPDQRTEPILPV